ncbi:MAG TPA: trigger factor [Rectinemataceae bacterium]
MIVSEKKIESLPHSRNKLSAVVSAAEVRAVYDEMMAEYTKKVRIDGFRVGKVPASVLERKFGETLRLEAMSRVLEKAVDSAMAEAEDKPLAYESPSMDGEPEFAIDKDFAFSVEYDVFPKFELPSMEGLEIVLPRVAVTEDDIQKELEQIRERNAIVVEKREAAEKGDIATLSWTELDAAGAPVPGTQREDFTFEIGKGLNLYRFDEDIIGMLPGSGKQFSKQYPEDYEYKELAGRTVSLSVTLTKLKHKDIPALDDELAQDISEKYKTVDDLKAAVKSQLESALEAKMRRTKEKAIVEALIARTSIDLPASMVNAELSMRWESLKREMGIDSDEKMERIAEYSGKSRSTLMEEWKPAVEKAIAGRLLVDKLLESGTYTCTEEDLAAEYAKQAEASSITAEEVKAEYEKRQSVHYLEEQIREGKLFDALLEKTAINPGESRSYMDFMSGNE